MSSRSPLILIGVIFAAHVALFAFVIGEPDAMLEFDRGVSRLSGAQAVATAGSVSELVLVTGPRATVGDYAWHGLVLRLFGGWLPGIQLVQLALLALSMLALYSMVGDLGGNRSARWTAVLLYGLIPIDFIVPHMLASEAIFNPLVIFGCFFLVRYGLRRRSAGELAMAGAAFSLAAVTRPELLAWLPVMFAILATIAARLAPKRALVHLALLLAVTCSLPALWLTFRAATTGEISYGGSRQTLAFELEHRRRSIETQADVHEGDIAEPAVDESLGSALHDYIATSAAHPLISGREWLLHTGKLLFLPDNLDVFRYLGVYRFTGQRSALVHSHGVVGAARALFEEMPGLMTWLLVTIALFLVVWLYAVRGVMFALRRSDLALRLVALLLLSLPVVYVALRVLTQGESRKRSPVDFVLAAFAALGMWHASAGEPELRTATDADQRSGDADPPTLHSTG